MESQVEVDIKVNVEDNELPKLKDKIKQIGKEGDASFKKMKNVSGTCLTDFMGKMNLTKNQMRTLEELTKTWGDAFDYNAARLQRLGVNINGLGGKLKVTGETLKLGWTPIINSIKQKVTGLGQTIKTSLGGAVNSVKTKLSGLRTAFNEAKTGAMGAGKGLGFLSSAASMTVGMVGFELFNGLVQSGRESINAAGKMQAFGKRLGMTGAELNKFSQETDALQSQFKKVDMRGVGASAAELGVKLQLPKERMSDLTQMIAVASSAFVNEGRTQEDAILAVSDALDGQFQKLRELGITQDKLKANGWNGNLEDTNSLMQALNKTMDEMGFTETAKGIYTLDDAYQALTVAGGKLLADVLIPLTPVITGAVDVIISGIDGVKKVVGDLANLWNNLPDWSKIALGVGAVALAVGLLGGYITFMIEAVGVTAIPVLGTLISFAGTLAGAIAAISWPVVAVIAAIGLLVAGFEQLGEWLGWWDSFGGMLESIKAGVLRLWDAFTNSRIVQAAIGGIMTAFNALKDVVMAVFDWIGDAWNSLFGGAGGGNPDAIGAIIDAFTTLEDVIFNVIGTVQQLWNAYMEAISPIVGNLQAIGSAIMGLFSGQTSVLDFLGTLVYNLADMWLNIASLILSAIGNLFAMLVPLVAQGLAMVWQGFLDFGNLLAQLPGMLMNIFTQVVVTVGTWMANMTLKAATFGPQFVANLIKALPSLPGKFASELGKIITAVGTWGSKLIEKAGQIITDFANKIKNGISDAIDAAASAVTGSAGFGSGEFGGSAGFISSGFDAANSVNNRLINAVETSNTNQTTNNFNFEGIIEKDAATFIVDAVKEDVKRNNLIRGVQ